MFANKIKSKRFWITSGLVGGVVALMLHSSNASDPCRDQVVELVSVSEQLVSRLGPISDVKVRRTLRVQDAISIQDKFEAGYVSYDLVVRGAKGKALVTAESGLKSCNPVIRSIEGF